MTRKQTIDSQGVWYKKSNGQVNIESVTHQLPWTDRLAQLDQFRGLACRANTMWALNLQDLKTMDHIAGVEICRFVKMDQISGLETERPSHLHACMHFPALPYIGPSFAIAPYNSQKGTSGEF